MRAPHDRSEIAHPRRDWDGRAITAKPLHRAPSRSHAAVIHDHRLVAKVEAYNRSETVRGRYYWHYDHGRRYCHYHDAWGVHWYGWYAGPDYFWVRYDYGRWWWYDRYWRRWVYWNAGYWWWHDPVRVEVVYVYTDGAYYRYSPSRGGAVLRPDPTPPVEAPPEPAPAPGQLAFYSEDGTRLVQVYGDRREAFLYDSSGEGDPRFLAFLTEGVPAGTAEAEGKAVEFRRTEQGLVIVVAYEKETDGTKQVFSRMFDAEGRPFGEPPPAPGEALKESPSYGELRDLADPQE